MKMQKMSAHNETVVRDYFRQMADSIGGIYSASNRSIDTLLDGNFKFHHYNGGLSTHVSHVKELQDDSNFVELPAAISFNILFEGSIQISLANEAYQLGPASEESIECSAIIAPQPEVLTRHIKKGMHVRKLNLFVERTWLEARCKNISDHSLIMKLFQRGTTFLSWKASKEMIFLANQLMQVKPSATVTDEIQHELLTMKLLLQCMYDLEPRIVKKNPISQMEKWQDLNAKQQLKQQVDNLLHNNYTLQEIATTLNMSVSTLQRHFKKRYGLTVNTYLSQRKLEKARKSLILDDISIGEAAYLAGYAYPSNFITAFKRKFSITPTALIQKHRKPRCKHDY